VNTLRMPTTHAVGRLLTFLSAVHVLDGGDLGGGSSSLETDSTSHAAAVAAAAAAGGYKARLTGRCERITIPLCLDMKYNMTRMPNLVGQSTQAEAAMQVLWCHPVSYTHVYLLYTYWLAVWRSGSALVSINEVNPC